MKIQLPGDVEYILEVLNNSGHEAFVVGGCVRDSIIGRTPGDWDIAASAKPDQVKGLFSKTIETGAKHGTITIVLNGENYEVTTYRIDGEYEDNRRPASVAFTTSIEEDLSRRDFTSNAIAYNHERGIVDPYGGRKDIQNKILKAVGDPGQRYKEDALRMLRAVRFSAQLGFKLEELTFQAIKMSSNLINNVSKERIRDELEKLLISDNPSKFHILKDTGLLRFILPEFEQDILPDDYFWEVLSEIERDKVLRWTVLLHKIVGNDTKRAEGILRRLRFDNGSINKILRLIHHYDLKIESSESAVRKAAAAIGEDIFVDLLKIKDREAQEQLSCFMDILSMYMKIKEQRHCISIKDLAINGDDLIKMGINPGKEIGRLLNEAFVAVLERPELNTREGLIQFLKLNRDR